MHEGKSVGEIMVGDLIIIQTNRLDKPLNLMSCTVLLKFAAFYHFYGHFTELAAGVR